MKIKISDHFNYSKMLRFTFPSIMMMIFTSIYGMVDGFFISNFVGAVPFAAVNLVMPFIMVLGAVGMVFGSGGSALVSMKLGMGKKEEANEIFSFLIYSALVFGTVLSAVGFVAAEPVARFLGATDEMLPYCITYQCSIHSAVHVPGFLRHCVKTAFRPVCDARRRVRQHDFGWSFPGGFWNGR